VRSLRAAPALLAHAMLLHAAMARPLAVPDDAGEAARNAAPAPIYTWAENAPAWDQRLHISGYRVGCNVGDADECLRAADATVRQRGLASVFASMSAEPLRSPTDALDFSRLSLSHPSLAEAGFDDFIGRYRTLFARPGFDAPAWLREVIHNLKAVNPGLAFGITLYEDELDSPYARPPYLPADAAGSVDYVHLFLHYREDATHFAQYVEQVKTLFPHARVIAGLYAYDRIDYISCSPTNHRPCTRKQEIKLYRQSAAAAARLLKDGKVAGIEFYPGFFGTEAEWDGWKRADYCAPARVQQCVDNTRTMRKATVKLFDDTMGWRQ
jgi:hypothetical protein